MNIVEWFKARQLQAQQIQSDAQHMYERYGSGALEMCDYAIACATDVELRHNLRQVRRRLARKVRWGAVPAPAEQASGQRTRIGPQSN